MRILRDANLARETRSGRERRYRLHAADLHRVHNWVKRYEVFWESRLAGLSSTLHPLAGEEMGD